MLRILSGLLLAAFLAVSGGCSVYAQSESYTKSIGVVRWTKSTVALTGASQALLAAQITPRAGFITCNPSANGTIYLDVAGGTVATNTGIPVVAGTCFSIIGGPTPGNSITVIGTNTQSVYMWEGN